MNEERRRQLVALADWHQQWAVARLDVAAPLFEARGSGSDYNQHHVDLDADDDVFHDHARRVLADKIARGLVRHMPGGHQHNQLSHAGDLLNLAGRIELGDGETLVASGEIDPTEDAARVLYAVVDSPKGRQIRLAVIDPDGGDRWRAGNKGATANLSVDQARTLRGELSQAADTAKRHAREADAEWNSGGPPTDPVLLGTEPVTEGRVHSTWGPVQYQAWVTDDDPTDWEVSVWVSNDATADSAMFEPKELRKLLEKLDELSGEAVRAEPQGGQFALGGGRVGAKPAQQKRQRRKSAPGSVLGFNPRTGQGTGYGSKNGDARVRSLQEALNKLGLTDAAGKPLKLDGKLGPKTTAAIKKLQQQLGMTPNGRVTPLFLSKITSAESVDKLKASIQKPAVKPAARAAFLQALSTLLLEDHIVRHPGHPNQKVHGRKGPGGIAKTAVKEAVKKVADAVDVPAPRKSTSDRKIASIEKRLADTRTKLVRERGRTRTSNRQSDREMTLVNEERQLERELREARKGAGTPAVKIGPPKTTSSGAFAPKRDMTFRKFRDFQDALGNGDLQDFDDSGHRVYPPGSKDGFGSSQEDNAAKVAGAVADRWDVSRDDLVELHVASGANRDDLAGVSTDQLKRDYVVESIVGHNTSGHVATTVAGVTIAERHGWPVELTEDQQAEFDHVKDRPALLRGLTGLANAQYDATQAWFKEHGVTEVALARGMHRADGDREGLPFTSWSANYGGVIGSVGGGFNIDYDDPAAVAKEYDAERSIRVATIPVERIYSTALTGPGTIHEQEVVVLPMPKSASPDDDPLTTKYRQDRPAERAAFTRALGSLLLRDHIVRHPGHPNQKVHGRRGRFVAGAWRQVPTGELVDRVLSDLEREWDDDTKQRVAARFGSVRAFAEDQVRFKGGTTYTNGPHAIHFAKRADIPRDVQAEFLGDADFLQSRYPIDSPMSITVDPADSFNRFVGGETEAGTGKMRINANILSADGDFGPGVMPAAGSTSRRRYLLAHEWGHAADDDYQSLNGPDAEGMSRYGSHAKVEGYAEAFAEWALTEGETTNPAARAYAEQYGWAKRWPK